MMTPLLLLLPFPGEALRRVRLAKSRLRSGRCPDAWPRYDPALSVSAPALGGCCVRVLPDASALTPAQFREACELPAVPALLGHLMDDWPALPAAARAGAAAECAKGDSACARKDVAWTLPNLVQRFGGAEFQVGDDDAGAWPPQCAGFDRRGTQSAMGRRAV